MREVGEGSGGSKSTLYLILEPTVLKSDDRVVKNL